jgi:hypothetical protein
MKWIEIEKVSEFDKIKSLYWDDAFVREIYMLSPSYVDFDGSLVDNNYLNVLILIFFAHGDKSCIGIELFLKNVEYFDLSLYGCFLNEEPDLVSLSSFKTIFELKLGSSLIKTNGLKYRFIDESYLGDRLEYGKKNFYYDKKFFPYENDGILDDIRESSLYNKINNIEDIEKEFLKIQYEFEDERKAKEKALQKIRETVLKFYKKGFFVEELAEDFDLSQKEIEEIINKNK